MASDSTDNTTGGNNLAAILTSLQQGVTAINNLTQAIKLIFPSS